VCKFSKIKKNSGKLVRMELSIFFSTKVPWVLVLKEIKCQAICQQVDDGTPPNVAVSSPKSIA
jgi:hypothetical protein